MYTFLLAPVYLLSCTVDSDGTLPLVSTLPATLFEAWGVHRAQGKFYLLRDHQSSMMKMKGTYHCDKRGSNGGD